MMPDVLAGRRVVCQQDVIECLFFVSLLVFLLIMNVLQHILFIIYKYVGEKVVEGDGNENSSK
jgi:hypothetical protein